MKKRVLAIILLATVLFSNISIGTVDTYAADGTVKIFLGDSDTPRHHKAIEEGGLSEYLTFELNDGKVKSSSFASSNTSLFKIEMINGKTYIRGIKEGTGYVILTVINDENKTFRERLFISIYKKVETCIGILNKTADGYRGASDNADVEKEDAKGKIIKNTKVDIGASCSNYYLIRTKDGRVFDDDLDTAFVKKKDLNIPISVVKLNKNNLEMKVGDAYRLSASILPGITTENKTIKWSSSNKNVVVVYSDGNIYAKKSGVATIYAKGGSVTNGCKIIVKNNPTSKTTSLNTKGKKIKVKGKTGIKPKYRYAFLNNEAAFGDKYKLSNKLINKLAKKLVKAKYYSKIKDARKAIKRALNGNRKDKEKRWKWEGSCYGMAITTALNKKKQINVRKYTKSKGKGHQINKVSKPKTNKITAYIINYYHASQVGVERYKIIHGSNDEMELKKLVKNAKKKYMESFAFHMNEKKTNKSAGSHRILLLGYSKKKSNKKWHAIKCYDNFYSLSNRYVYISKKYNEIRVQGWSRKHSIWGFESSTDFSKYSKIKID